MKPTARILTPMLLLATMLPAASTAAASDADVPLHLEGDIAHVANIPYNNGSDLEFATKTVVKLSEGATGDPVCLVDEEQEDGCARDEDGAIVYETEERDFAFAGRVSNNVQVIDITTPAAPVRVAEVLCRLNQNDVQVAGDTLLMAADAAGSCTMPDGSTLPVHGFATADISDPRNPKVLGRAQQTTGGHTITVHPTEPLVYVSNSNIDVDANIHIWDISNPATPVKVRDWAPYPVGEAPHDVTFNAAGDRAYSAAQDTRTDIIDTTDPRNPELISTIWHEGVTLAHQADPTPDGKYLLISDEFLWGGPQPVSPGGLVHVYDIRNEERPVKVGAFGNDCVGFTCQEGPGVHTSTAHVFRINPDGYTMAIGWYNDGVHVIDFSDIRGLGVAGLGTTGGAGPRTIGGIRMPNSNVWAAKMWQERHPGYVFSNDLGRGFDVFHVSSLGPGFVATGSIKAGQPTNYALGAGVTRSEWERDCDFTPATNGVDSWIAAIPEGYAEGSHTLTARAIQTAVDGLYDLDLYFYDQACVQIGMSEEEGTDEIAEIPAGTAYVMVADFIGQNTKIHLSADLT